MKTTKKKILVVDGVRYGIASVLDEDGSPMLQVARLISPAEESPLTSVSYFIDCDTLDQAEMMFDLTDESDIPSLVMPLEAEDEIIEKFTSKFLKPIKPKPKFGQK